MSMGLDIRFTRRKQMVCPKCGEVIGHTDVDTIAGGGRVWYPFLESIGYYVPYEQRTEENDWYGKDMVLTEEQAKAALKFAKKHDLYGSILVTKLIAEAIYEKDSIVVNADW